MRNCFKTTVGVIVVICILFAWQLIYDACLYHGAVADIAEGKYAEALVQLEKLDTYQDSEVLSEYCRIMAEYDATDYASVCRSYHRVKALNIDNEALAVSLARVETEIAVRYEVGLHVLPQSLRDSSLSEGAYIGGEDVG